MNRWLLRSLFALALITVLGGVPMVGVAAGGPVRTYVAADCSGAVVKPHTIVLACGDAGLIATKLSWSRWTSTTAVGNGTGEAKVCEPDCAAGRLAKGPMRLQLLRPRVCPQDDKRHFTKVRYTWVQGAPAGTGPRSGTVPLPCAVL